MGLRFSIVMPTLNRRDMLRRALASVHAQAWPEIEIIVVDGGSTDGTIEEIAAQPNVRLIRGPDRGVYDAFNKGIGQADGDIVGILNSDDLYEPSAFAAVAAAFSANPDAAAVCGTAILVADGEIIAKFDAKRDKALTSPRTALIGSCVPNARFFRRSAMQQVGPFSLDYRYVADRDWLTRWYEAGLRTVAIDRLVYQYQQHQNSLTFDPQGRLRNAIRTEQLALALSWRDNEFASPSTRHAAALLEGRSRGTLAYEALRHGDVGEALKLLLMRNGHASLRPISSVLRATADRMIVR